MNSNRNDYQRNPQNVQSRNVQLWRNGVMITAQISQSDARDMVANGQAFVISAQAIGAMSNGQRNP